MFSPNFYKNIQTFWSSWEYQNQLTINLSIYVTIQSNIYHTWHDDWSKIMYYPNLDGILFLLRNVQKDIQILPFICTSKPKQRVLNHSLILWNIMIISVMKWNVHLIHTMFSPDFYKTSKHFDLHGNIKTN